MSSVNQDFVLILLSVKMAKCTHKKLGLSITEAVCTFLAGVSAAGSGWSK